MAAHSHRRDDQAADGGGTGIGPAAPYADARPYPNAYPYSNPPPDGGDLRNLFGVLRRRRAIILATACVLTSLSALIALHLTPWYTAASAVMIEPSRTNVVDVEAVVEGLPQDAAVIETQLNFLRSRSHAQRVIEELGLLSDPEFNPAARPADSRGGVVGAILDRLPDAILERLPEKWLVATGFADDRSVALAPPPEPRIARGDPIEAELAAVGEAYDDPYAAQMATAVDRLLAKLAVGREGQSHVLAVGFTSTDRRKAVRVANAVAELYVGGQLEEKVAETDQATDWLARRVEELREEVLQSERAVEEYRAANELVEAGGGTLSAQQLASLTAELIDARADRTTKEDRLRRVRELRDAGEGYDSMGEVMASPVIIALREQEVWLLREEAQLSWEYGERHPSIRQLRLEQQKVADRIEQEIQSVILNLENNAAAARSREQALEESLEEARGRTTLTDQAAVGLRELERETAANRALYENFLIRLKETEQQRQLLRPDARVISPAAVPRAPSFPKPELMIAAGFTVSLMLGTVLAFLVDQLDRGMHSRQQVEEVLGAESFGFIPTVKKTKRRQNLHRYLLDKPRSTYAESIRAVRKALQLSCVDHPPQVVLVTSAVPEEGKTTLATSLAASAARSGHRTVVVDLDLRHPSIAREMDQPVDADLIDLLVDNLALDEALYQDAAEPNLHFLPVKRHSANPADLIDSQKMVALLSELRRRYDYVILDSAPALGVVDTKVAALLADAVLFAVRWQKTKEDIAVNGVGALADERITVAGAVLTRVDLRRHARYGYGDAGQYYETHRKYYMN